MQDLYGSTVRYLGPAHGFAGNVVALAQGDGLDGRPPRGARAACDCDGGQYAQRADGLCQWPPSPDRPRSGEPQPIRTQWCHGAPGIVASLTSLAPGDEQLSELLLAGGELTWQAGPLAKGANLCHGTAGNGYAFLKLFERTGDELWLERARRFAMHAIEQLERSRAEHGRGRYTLWTGDLGTAVYLYDCLTVATAFPTLDVF